MAFACQPIALASIPNAIGRLGGAVNIASKGAQSGPSRLVLALQNSY